MTTPGDITETDKSHARAVPPKGSIDGGTALRIQGDTSDFDTQHVIGGKTLQGVYLPIGPTDFVLQGSMRFSPTVLQRPTWVQFELVRYKLDGTIDPTGKQRLGIVQPGTTTFPFVVPVHEFVNEDDGLFGWTVEAGNREDDAVPPSNMTVTFLKYQATNDRAQVIHEKHGFSRMSDGSISDEAWR